MPQSPEMVDVEKRRMLEEAGFVWENETRVWVSKSVRRAIPFESVRDRSMDWLREWLDCARGKPAKK